jgi:hypothetical protein
MRLLLILDKLLEKTARIFALSNAERASGMNLWGWQKTTNRN